MPNKTKKPVIKAHYKWILCTKWAQEVGKRVMFFWMPFGTQGRIPFFYNTQKEAHDALKEIADLFPTLEKRTVCALHVKYVPQKIKAYKKQWFDKYVVKEVIYELKDKSKKQEAFDDNPN